VKGLYIAVQAVLALCASWVVKSAKAGQSLTGTVIDSGDGVTHVIPVYEGYAIGSAIQSMPIAGRDITRFVHELLQDREKAIPADERMNVAKHVKETLCYTCPDIVKEFSKYDRDPGKWIKQYTGKHPRTKQVYQAVRERAVCLSTERGRASGCEGVWSTVVGK
jgi:actin-related protein 3